ncbi:MAG: hypothetical protein K2G44_07230 [Clostridia bacterium]|nr:hypothetical protein [Clostridia bacterium]
MNTTLYDIVVSVACEFSLTPWDWAMTKSGSKNIYYDGSTSRIKIYAYNKYELNEITNLFEEELAKNNYRFTKQKNGDEIIISII